MVQRLGDKRDAPDVPKLDFPGALAEIWFQINYAAYHLAYVRVYSQSAALRTKPEVIWDGERTTRDRAQVDVVICRTNLASFFWHLEHLFEALRATITRGQKEYPEAKYFWSYQKHLDEIEQLRIREEIKDYRNMAHQTPAIIGIKWDSEGRFLHHFLPTISGRQPKEDVEMNILLQQYFEFAANVWLEFVPGDLEQKFPRDFQFPVTVPHLFEGELPNELNGVPQLLVCVESYTRDGSALDSAAGEAPLTGTSEGQSGSA